MNVHEDKFPPALFDGFGIIHHKALNTRALFDLAVKSAKEYPGFVHIFEGDICWIHDANTKNTEFYFYHPKLAFDGLSASKLKERRKSGKTLGLDDIHDDLPDNILLIIELKVGTGDVSKSFDDMIDVLEARYKGRYWVDGFSKKLLKLVHQKNDELPISMHTERVIGQKIITGVPEWPPIYSTDISKLDWLDALSVRHWNNFNSIKNASNLVRSNSKVFFMSRLSTQRRVEQALTLKATAGYFETVDIPRLMPTIEKFLPLKI